MLEIDKGREIIQNGESILGVEFGSTRIKSVLINKTGEVLAVGIHNWENHYTNGIWTYPLDEVWSGMQSSYKNLCENVENKYNCKITKLASLAVSAMMHGYLPFDKNDNQLAEFRSWRNAITSKAADELTKLFNFNIPQRWSIAHLYQAILNKEDHVKDISHLNTLAGYVHWKLTGKKVLGVGEASGMFPISITTKQYDTKKLEQFNDLIKNENFDWNLIDILPKILFAGDNAGYLTEEGAKLIDPSGTLEPGSLVAPPEGDADTGMIATNNLQKRTGNVSAGTSAFAMLILEKELSKVYPEIDVLASPLGDFVAMAHANNCTTEINDWVNFFSEFLELCGYKKEKSELYTTLFKESLNGDDDCDNLVPYCFYSGEPSLNLPNGVPLFVHPTGSKLNVANFMRAQIYASFATMKLGMDLLTKNEGAKIDKMTAHGGIFTTPGVAQKYLAAALETKIDVIETASEGGAWGIALLAAYSYLKCNNYDKSLIDYLNDVFKDTKTSSMSPTQKDIDGFNKFMNNFVQNLKLEKEAINF